MALIYDFGYAFRFLKCYLLCIVLYLTIKDASQSKYFILRYYKISMDINQLILNLSVYRSALIYIKLFENIIFSLVCSLYKTKLATELVKQINLVVVWYVYVIVLFNYMVKVIVLEWSLYVTRLAIELFNQNAFVVVLSVYVIVLINDSIQIFVLELLLYVYCLSASETFFAWASMKLISSKLKSYFRGSNDE